jgi:glycerophosphoryl diester phosphodiesterase
VTRALVAVAGALGVLLAFSALAPTADPGPATLVAAHRGGAALWPENNLLAFRQALALGVDALEFDLHMTADGEVVVLHDPTLDRTSTAKGPVRELSLADLAPVQLKARDGTVTDERVSTFAQVLDLAASTSVELVPEIKIDTTGQRYDGIEEKVLALLRSRELGATDLGMNHRLIDTDVVSAARVAGIRLAAWTVNEEADIRRMIDLGVDMVMSDRPDLVKRLRER